MVTSDFSPEVEIWPFHSCAWKIRNITFIYDRIAKIFASFRKLGQGTWWWRQILIQCLIIWKTAIKTRAQGNERETGTNWGGRRAEQFPHLGNYILTHGPILHLFCVFSKNAFQFKLQVRDYPRSLKSKRIDPSIPLATMLMLPDMSEDFRRRIQLRRILQTK